MTLHFISHAHCFDGSATMYGLLKYFGIEDQSHKHHYLSHDQSLPELETGDVVYMGDYSRPAADLLNLSEMDVTTIINDHHESAIIEAIVAMASLRFHPKFNLKVIRGANGALSGLDEILDSGLTRSRIEDWIDQYDVQQVAYNVQNLRLNIDMSRSGSYLMWSYLFNEEPPRLLQYIDTRDRWAWELPYAEEITEGWGLVAATHSHQIVEQELKAARSNLFHPLHSLANSIIEPPDYMTNRKVLEQVNNLSIQEYFLFQDWLSKSGAIEELRELGTPLVEERRKLVAEVTAKATWAFFLGHWVPIVEAYAHYSWVGHELLKLYPKAPFSVTYKVTDNGDKLGFSLRSRPGFRCNRVAALLGGGGHKLAAGCSLIKSKNFDKTKKFAVPDVVINNGVPIRIDSPVPTDSEQPADTYVSAVKE